jgi:UDP-glucuronate 4-epimerase
MKYVVTGAAGFIGSHLAEKLLAFGHEVVAIDCFTDYYDPRLDLAEDDLDFTGVGGVFHLAGQPGVRSFGPVFGDYVRRNVLATQRVFEAATAARTRVVFASSSSVYGQAATYPTPEDTHPRPISPYGITKLSCEHLARAYTANFGLDVVVLRYFTVYGPRQRPDMALARIVEALAAGSPFELYGDGTQSRSFTYVSDAVDATTAAMEGGTPHETYNVGGGEEATMREAIDTLERISGRRLDLREGPPVPGDVRRTSADVSRLRRHLAWSPRVGLEEGLREQWLWASARVAAR